VDKEEKKTHPFKKNRRIDKDSQYLDIAEIMKTVG